MQAQVLRQHLTCDDEVERKLHVNSNMGYGKVIGVSPAQARMGGSTAIVLLRHSTPSRLADALR